MGKQGPTARVLTVEDEEAVRGLLHRLLSSEGYEVIEAGDALTALEAITHQPPDLVLLDVNLPGSSGIDLLQRLRRSSTVPVILLTGMSDEHDRINGLRQGADDYVVKPFSVGELLARIESVLRRSRLTTAPSGDEPLRFDTLVIDLTTRDVEVDDTQVRLTAREFDLLHFLARSPRQVFSREQLLQQVWGSSTDWQDDATVTEHVRRLRNKIEPDPDHPRWLVTVRGVGYRFEP